MAYSERERGEKKDISGSIAICLPQKRQKSPMTDEEDIAKSDPDRKHVVFRFLMRDGKSPWSRPFSLVQAGGFFW